MVNLLIVSDDFIYIKKFVNTVAQEFSMIRICKIFTNKKELIDFLASNTMQINIIFIDSRVRNITDKDVTEILNKDYKHSVIYASDNFKEVISNMKELYQKNQGISEKKITYNAINKQLKFLKYKDNLIGTKYIKEAIFLIATRSNLTSENLKKNVYSLLAKKYGKTVNNIKCNINHATELMNCDCERKVIKKYFSFYDDYSVASPKVVINTILNKIGKNY